MIKTFNIVGKNVVKHDTGGSHRTGCERRMYIRGVDGNTITLAWNMKKRRTAMADCTVRIDSDGDEVK